MAGSRNRTPEELAALRLEVAAWARTSEAKTDVAAAEARAKANTAAFRNSRKVSQALLDQRVTC